MRQLTTHEEQLDFLKKIEGQVRGIQKMIEEKRYCIDIITQIQAVIGALSKVEQDIFKKHINGCVAGSLKGKSEMEREKKINEVIDLISKFRRII